MNNEKKKTRLCANRRQFLLTGSTTAAMMMLMGPAGPKMAEAQIKEYPRKKIGKISKLKTGKPVSFTYPDDDSENFLIKVGEPAGMGIGKEVDIVAFNSLCTHMGGPMDTTDYKPADKVMGPCPFHLTTFDISRYGMVVSGHATQSLPQIQLQADGDDIYAIGVVGLIYGRNSNLA